MKNEKNLWKAVMEFIHSKPIGSTFTSKEYIAAVGHLENLTSWKNMNNNPHYRAHHYKSICRGILISRVKHGIWKVDRHLSANFSKKQLEHYYYL
jgi:hypothetical protein